ncbi:MAG: 30S ribosomal protein S9 [Phycisphaerae bacterium]|nr:30S ribosomal protein S9 [Phycisphaerae bacterium]
MSDVPENNAPEQAAPTEGTPSPAAQNTSVPAPVVPVGVVERTDTSPVHKVPSQGLFWGTGRRKTSIARVRILPGEGKILINKREVDKYFTEDLDRKAVTAPLKLVDALGRYNVFINVKGGGHTGQAGAIRMGVARALLAADNRCEASLRDSGFLTRDARRVERKKYGRRKARRRFQFSKR